MRLRDCINRIISLLMVLSMFVSLAPAYADGEGDEYTSEDYSYEDTYYEEPAEEEQDPGESAYGEEPQYEEAPADEAPDEDETSIIEEDPSETEEHAYEEAHVSDYVEPEAETSERSEELVWQTLIVEPEAADLENREGEPIPLLDSINGLWQFLFDRLPVPQEKDPYGVTLEISGWLPEGVTAKASYVQFDEKTLYFEPALLGFEVELFDAAGDPYEPEGDITVNVGGYVVRDAVLSGMALLVYSYEEDAEREKELETEFAADVKVNRDLPVLDEDIAYEVNRDLDPVVFAESDNAVTIFTDYTMEFKAETMPLHFVVSGQMIEGAVSAAPDDSETLVTDGGARPDGGEQTDGDKADIPPVRILWAASDDRATSVTVSGDFEDDVRAQVTSLNAGALDSDCSGAGVLALDINLSDDDSPLEPDIPMTVTIRDDVIASALADGSEIEVWQISDGDANRVHAYVSGSAVAFDTDSLDVYVITEVYLEKTLTTGDGSTYRISATYDKTAGIPADAELEVTEITAGGADYSAYLYETARLMGYTTDDLDYAKVMDISIVGRDSREHYQPNGNVDVRIELLDAGRLEDLQVVHFGEQTELLDAEVGGSEVSFRTDSFSVYVLAEGQFRHTYKFYVPGNIQQDSFKEYTIYTDTEGLTTFTQIIKAGEGLVTPQLPSLQSGEDETSVTFAGWYLDESSGSNINSPSLAGEAFDFDNLPEVTSNQEYHLYARFSNFAYVIFHEQYNGATNTWPITATKRGELSGGTSAQIVISDISVSYDSDESGEEDDNTAPAMAFRGWTKKEYVRDDNTVPENAPIESSPITISANTDLYPVFSRIHWLTFISGPTGSGATYYAPNYYYNDEGVTSLADYKPERRGYVFTGWYTDADASGNGTGVRLADANGALLTTADLSGSDKFEWSGSALKLKENATIYAGWEPANDVTYTVLYWQQNANDDEYSLAGYDLVTGTAEAQTNVTASDTKYDYFHLSDDQDKETAGNQSGIQQQTVNGNGSTVVNVYYDRNEYTLWFWIGARNGNNNYVRNTTENWRGNWKTEVRTNNQTRKDSYRNWTSSTNPFTSSEYKIVSETISNYTYYYIELTARYEEDLSDKWPTLGIGGVNTYKFNSWACDGNTKYRLETNVNTIKGLFPIMSSSIITVNGVSKTSDQGATNIFLALYATSNYDYTYNYYFWDPDTGEYPSEPDKSVASAATSQRTSATVAAFNGYTFENKTYDNDYKEIKNGKYYGGTVNFYYKPIGGIELSFQYNGEILGSDGYYYGQSLSDADKYTAQAQAAAPTGYEFVGWYEDPYGAGDPFDFETRTMPNSSLALYPKYQTQWYLIQVDPNGGQMKGHDGYSTWFWKVYGTTELVREYENTTRDFIEDLNGTWYYAVKDRRYYKEVDPVTSAQWVGELEDWQSLEDGLSERTTYYTQDISDPAIVDLNTRYKQAQDAFRYAQWYEVEYDDEGNETGERLYNFQTQITRDLTLKLHWKQVGTYFIRYDAGEGAMDEKDSNEDTFKILESSDYADHSDVVVTRTANAPEGYNFVGWTIKNDDSGKVYYPGEAFEFQSKFAETEVDEQGDTKDVLTLEACYTRVATAKIVYDANGGALSSGFTTGMSVTAATGYPVDEETKAQITEPVPTITVTPGEGDADDTLAIGNLVNNTAVKLSDGSCFTRDDARFKGWSTTRDSSGLLEKDEHGDYYYYVDTDEPVELYAIWEVQVAFNRNKTDSSWGDAWEGYETDGETRYKWVTIGDTITQPVGDPTSSDEKMFLYWTTEQYKDDQTSAPPFDFSEPITEKTTLYGFWGQIEVRIHAVDTTYETIADKDGDWLSQTVLRISGTTPEISFAVKAAHIRDGVDLADYSYFAAISTDKDSISEENKITAVSYNSVTHSAAVKMADSGETIELPSGYEIYLVYWLDPVVLDIGYKVMETSGALENATMALTGYPTSATLGTYSFDGFTNSWGPQYYTNYKYEFYSYAIGDKDALTGANLRYVSDARDIDSNQPNLQVRNTWRGLQYSTDNGSTWTACGYYGDIQLYVVYYQQQPTVITIGETTVGTRSDAENQSFHYTVHIVNTQSDDGTINDTTFDLKSGETRIVTLFSWTTGDWWNRVNHNQTITVTQDSAEGYTTSNDANGDGTSTQPYTWTYTTTNSIRTLSVTYTNTHTPLNVELRVAMGVGGGVMSSPALRKASPEDYTLSLDIDATEALSETEHNPFIGGDGYTFAGVIYGTEAANGAVTPLGETGSIGYIKPTGEDYYDLYLSDGTPLADNCHIYFVYYKTPKIYYASEAADGTLTKIADPITYNGTETSMNGVTVSNGGTILNVGATPLVIDQSVAGGYRVPPNLDGANPLSYRYIQLGAGNADAGKAEDLAYASEGKTLRLKVEDYQVKWSVDGEAWTPFDDAPTVYAIYREEFNLSIAKNLANDIGWTSGKTFTVTIKSRAITDTVYSVTGYGAGTVAAVPASGTTPGQITLTLRSSDPVVINALPKGEGDYGYSIRETLDDRYTLSASVDGTAVDAASITTDDTTIGFSIDLNAGKQVVLTNTRKTATVTVEKKLEDDETTGFSFTAILTENGNAVAGWEDFETGENNNEQAFILKADGTKQILTVPVGTTLTLRENDADDYDAVFTGDVSTTDASSKTCSVEVAAQADYAVVCTNTPRPVGSRKVILRKVATGTYASLSGAKFTLYKDSAHSKILTVDEEALEDLESQASGVFYVGELPYGTYYAVETTAPTGYVAQSFTVTVSDDGVSVAID